MRKLKVLLFGIIVFLLLVIITGIGGYFYLQNSYNYIPSKNFPSLDPIELTEMVLGKMERINFLFFGVDERKEDIGRSDTIIFISFNLKDKKVDLLSIPRDTRVLIPGFGYDKINHAYHYGGVDLAVRTVEEFLGVSINYYAKMNFQQFEKLIDAIGGVDIEIEKPMYYVDRTDKLYIRLKPGKHHLNGKEALGYVRFRHDPLGDLGRIERQQKFLKALYSQMKDKVSLINLPQYINLVGSTIETNISFYEALFLASKFINIENQNIRMTMMPGNPDNINGISYVLPDFNKLKEWKKSVFANEENKL
ncbi:MAG: LCP family protein [Dictyoglomus sp.]|nr:LCP family protein [Dictyoglomus sp.]MCX7942292.1 LCP family protein [Dictyoglomaceae bacterium]MDW8187868.1 LCP family protein [Dictyoglomus sp.]